MNKQELIESISHLPSDCSRPRPMIDKLTALELIELLDEPQKVKVPQFVADYIDFKKTYDFHVYGAMRVIEDHYDKRVQEWFYEGNIETFVHAWLDGYEVDKEPKYTVKFKATKQYLSNDEIGIHFDPSFRSNFRKSDLEKLGLAEVFNSPLFEVEEVTK